MSYYSYIINKENKTYYCLGSGCFADMSFEIEVGALTDSEYLAGFLFYDVFGGYDQKGPDDLRECCIKIANELYEFANGYSKDKFFVFNDCGDDLWVVRCLGYRCVGSRYGKDDIKNDHFNPDRKHMYNVGLILNTGYQDLYERYR